MEKIKQEIKIIKNIIESYRIKNANPAKQQINKKLIEDLSLFMRTFLVNGIEQVIANPSRLVSNPPTAHRVDGAAKAVRAKVISFIELSLKENATMKLDIRIVPNPNSLFR